MSVAISKWLSKSEVKRDCWRLLLIVNGVIWGSALLFLKLSPATYTSRSAIAVPGESASVNVNLPNIGAANYENSAPYTGGSTQDPRENYKFIAQSEPVIKEAAEQLNMTPKQFAKPQIKVVVNSAVMEISFKGKSAKEAHDKALSFYQVFEKRLDGMRMKAVAKRDLALQQSLDRAKQKLEIAQKRLSRYKASSGLNSEQQITELAGSIEILRRQRAELLAQQQKADDRLQQLATDLKLSTRQAADALSLKSDVLVQQSLRDYGEAKAALDVLNSKYLPGAPPVVEQRAKVEEIEQAILTQSQILLGRSVSLTDVRQLSLNNSSSISAREELFQELIAARAERKGLQGQGQILEQQIGKFENKLENLGEREVTLDALKQDLQVAETVFASTLAKLNIGDSNAFGSYPLVEMVIEPTLPEEPSWPRKEFVLLGTVLCSVFASAGIGLIWLRQRQFPRESA